MSRNTSGRSPKLPPRQAKITPFGFTGWTPSFKIKKPVLPKAKITNAEQGEMKITVSKKVKPGIYELVLNGNDGQQMVITKIEVV